MIPDMNDLMSPDLQKIMLFLLPALAALSVLVLGISRGRTIGSNVLVIVCAAIALYFAPGFLELIS